VLIRLSPGIQHRELLHPPCVLVVPTVLILDILKGNQSHEVVVGEPHDIQPQGRIDNVTGSMVPIPSNQYCSKILTTYRENLEKTPSQQPRPKSSTSH
jgi:hypothetical protein